MVPKLARRVVATIGDVAPLSEILGRPVRVVFVDHVARMSGGEIALLRLLPTLAEHAEVWVILGEEGPLRERLEEKGIHVEVLPLPPRLRDVRRDELHPARLDPSALSGLTSYVRLLRARVRALDADLVHTNSLKAALYGGVAARLARVPVVWHVRDRIASDYLPGFAVGLVRAAAFVVPTAIVANSRETMSTVPPGRRRNVLYNAIVPDSVDDAPSLDDRPHERLVIGMIGRLTQWKGQDVFLDAFAEAFRGSEVRARLVGSALFGEEAYAKWLEQKADALGLADQVEFRGFREDVWKELRELDVLVHCSVRPEPFGQVVLEGLAAGVPVVAAAAGGPLELITNDVDGLLTTPGDSAALAAALRRLADDPKLRRRLAAAGLIRSREFTPERTVERLLGIYAEVIAARRHRNALRARLRRR